MSTATQTARPASRYDIAGLIAELGDIPVVTETGVVRRKSRDFFWYSPVLKRQLDHVTADLVVTPLNEAEVVRAVKAAFKQGAED